MKREINKEMERNSTSFIEGLREKEKEEKNGTSNKNENERKKPEERKSENRTVHVQNGGLASD